ncbi:MAG TPA: citrate (Si)-synthase, partial [Geothrix sp.]|nr:citrate (Si)-synthase [Geothrix sp.]
MTRLKSLLLEKIQEQRPRTQKLTKEFADVVIDQVNIGQVIGGARDIHALVTDISYLDPQEGIRFRGKNIPETFAALPKAKGGEYPTVEAFWFFLLTGEIPTQAEADEVLADFQSRAKVPSYVFDVLKAMPKDSHPMAMLSTAVLAMQKDSLFAKQYHDMKKNDYWDAMYEDASNLVARLPEVAAFIYRWKYKNGDIIAPKAGLDMGANFAHMMGIAKPYDDVARMYFILHSDHESGNVSAHTTHLVASALSDAYYSFSAGLNGLAGPLHGLANQEVLDWIMGFQKKLAGAEPTEENVKQA